MIYNEKRMNLFDVTNDYYLAHCISSDCVMGAGIAVIFQRKFPLKTKLLSYTEEERKYPTCIRVERVFNLITKNRCYEKPTYKTLEVALIKMKEQAIEGSIKKIAMPKIASGLDGLEWEKVKVMIQGVFSETDIEILVCSI